MSEEKKEKVNNKESKKTASAKTADVSVKKKKKKSKKQHITSGRIYIHATYNNTIVNITDKNGNSLAQSSAGRCGFKGPTSATPYAAGMIVKDAGERVKDYGLKDVDVFVEGIGSGREGAIRAVNSQGFNMLSIRDITPTPHNGCRMKKPRKP